MSSKVAIAGIEFWDLILLAVKNWDFCSLLKMSLRIKAVVDKFVQELKEALDADIQDRILKEREMQSYIEEREREVAEREAAWKAELSRREVWFACSHCFCLYVYELMNNFS